MGSARDDVLVVALPLDAAVGAGTAVEDGVDELPIRLVMLAAVWACTWGEISACGDVS